MSTRSAELQLRAGRDLTLEVRARSSRGRETTGLHHRAGGHESSCRVLLYRADPDRRVKRPDPRSPRARDERSAGLRKGGGDLLRSTVYPGCTRRVCVPSLDARVATSVSNRDFSRYDPSGINPGDKEHRINTIRKVTSADPRGGGLRRQALLAPIVKAGTHRASSIKVAESREEVIEITPSATSTIALIQRADIYATALGIDTRDVALNGGRQKVELPALQARDWWAGHCIGVDPSVPHGTAQVESAITRR